MPFIDEAARDPSLVAFRDALLSVIRERDIEGLLTMTDKNVVVWTNICGRGELRNRLRGDEDVWEDWERVLSHGSGFHLRFSKHYGRWRLVYASSSYW